jgi:hypothetical protein
MYSALTLIVSPNYISWGKSECHSADTRTHGNEVCSVIVHGAVEFAELVMSRQSDVSIYDISIHCPPLLAHQPSYVLG